MTNLKDVIIELREVYANEDWSYTKILKAMEDNNDFVSKSTLSRLFGDSWEEYSFDYERTIRPIAKVMLGIEQIEETDSMDIKAMKSILKYKSKRIEELEAQIEHLTLSLANEKVRYHEKLDEERAIFNNRIDFLKEQVAYKDKRMDMLLGWIDEKDAQNKEMLAKVLVCSKCPMGAKDEG